MNSIAILHAAQLATLAGPARARVGPELGDLAIIEDGGMLVRDGIIVATGSSAEIGRQIPNDVEIVDARGRVVLGRREHLGFGRDDLVLTIVFVIGIVGFRELLQAVGLTPGFEQLFPWAPAIFGRQ